MRKVYHPNRVVNTGIVLLVVPFLLLLISIPLILTVHAMRRQEVVDPSGFIPLVILAGALGIALWQGAHYSGMDIGLLLGDRRTATADGRAVA